MSMYSLLQLFVGLSCIAQLVICSPQGASSFHEFRAPHNDEKWVVVHSVERADNSSIEITQWMEDQPIETLRLVFSVNYRTKAFAVQNKGDNEIKLSMKFLEGYLNKFANAEAITLEACNQNITLSSAIKIHSSLNVLDDLRDIDNNVVVLEEGIELVWKIPETCTADAFKVLLTANSHADGTPLQFPLDETHFLHYSGEGEDHFTEFWRPGSGHPAGPVYLDMKTEGADVHFFFDVTSDNTDEFGKDWAEIIVRSEYGTTKTFHWDDFHTEWANCTFGASSKAAHKHQQCHFIIPQQEVQHGEPFDFRFQYYGTSCTVTLNDLSTNSTAPYCGELIRIAASANVVIEYGGNSGTSIRLSPTNITDEPPVLIHNDIRTNFSMIDVWWVSEHLTGGYYDGIVDFEVEFYLSCSLHLPANITAEVIDKLTSSDTMGLCAGTYGGSINLQAPPPTTGEEQTTAVTTSLVTGNSGANVTTTSQMTTGAQTVATTGAVTTEDASEAATSLCSTLVLIIAITVVIRLQ